MSGIEPKRPSFVVYLLVLALSFTGLAGVSRARTQDIPQNGAQDLEQEKEKKEEKKDDKKDEKKGLPLKSDRKVSFTTEEGTWLSLDVSPDGKTIAMLDRRPMPESRRCGVKREGAALGRAPSTLSTVVCLVMAKVRARTTKATNYVQRRASVCSKLHTSPQAKKPILSWRRELLRSWGEFRNSS